MNSGSVINENVNIDEQQHISNMLRPIISTCGSVPYRFGRSRPFRSTNSKFRNLWPSLKRQSWRYYLSSENYPRLSKQQVTYYLEQNQYTSDNFDEGAVKYFVTNSLAANNPSEDRAAEVRLKLPGVDTNQFLFGMFDGHAGCACAQLVSEQIFSYIAVMLSSHDVHYKIKNGEIDPYKDLLSRFCHTQRYVSRDLEDLYRKNLEKLAQELLIAPNDDLSVEDILNAAFLRLDHDILAEGEPTAHKPLNLETISQALSGACANVAFINGSDLYVANTGDCKAVLGQQTDGESCVAIPLSADHSAENESEVERIFNKHPLEKNKVLRNGRLLGDLAPLRSFGDARYKWSSTTMKHILNVSNPNMISIYGENLIPNFYHTPPYLTAEPEIIHHSLNPRDKFLILASDGLWEHLDEQVVVDLVAAHLDEKQFLIDFELPSPDITLKEVNEILKIRKKKLAKKPLDENAATHLLRMALGPKHAQVSQYLTLPEPVVRQYRDDITITIVFFDSDYLMKRSL